MARSRRERRRGKISPAHNQRAEKLKAPSADYHDEQGSTLSLRGSLTIGARQEYAQTLAGRAGTAAATPEDAAQRAFELLFERLALRWEIAGAPPIERQRELLARFRAATTEERAFVRDALRRHCAERFPDVQAP